MAEPSELLPCPFCGSEAHIIFDGPTKEQVQHSISWGHDVGEGWYRAQCKSCGTSVGEFRKRKEVAPAWNRRSDTRQAAEIAALRGAMQRCVNEVAGVWSAFDLGLREEISNTNYQCVLDRLAEARAALASPSSHAARLLAVVEAAKQAAETIIWVGKESQEAMAKLHEALAALTSAETTDG